MTSRVLAASCPDRTRSGRAGFTIVELLVVIGILALLASIIIAAVNHSRRAAATIKVKSDLQAVATALEAYKADFRRYPMRRLASDPMILAKALVGPGPAADDGQDGQGFRTVTGGKIWPAYLPADRFRAQKIGNSWELLDSYGNAIQYYPKRATICADGTPITKLIGPILASPPPDYMFDDDDGTIPRDIYVDAFGKKHPYHPLQYVLGDRWKSSPPFDNQIVNGHGEQLRFAGDYILASPGPDGRWLRANDDPTSVDDAFNFDL